MESQLTLPSLGASHLLSLTGKFGLYEHARYSRPDPAHGYTTDDNARVLVLIGTYPQWPADLALATYLDFVTRGRVPMGWHNRLSEGGEWADMRGSDDAHGRALWGLGVALAAGLGNTDAAAAFLAGLDLDSPHPRANCYALLGAAAALRAEIYVEELDGYVGRALARLPGPAPGSWRWPEPRLTYDNGRIPQTLIEIGSVVDRPDLIENGLELLEWLVDVEWRGDRFSFTPAGGRGPGDRGPGFDQQPIEAWAMADACLAAVGIEGASIWRDRVEAAASWFFGRNDVGVAVADPDSGAGYDGLESDGVNLNQGAESTLAAIGSLNAWATLASRSSI